ncbi:MAG: hypothetical protein UU67_C0059G0009, partial [Candidatus Daviesbacteria bacterium GW2011_GWB1_41_5]
RRGNKIFDCTANSYENQNHDRKYNRADNPINEFSVNGDGAS